MARSKAAAGGALPTFIVIGAQKCGTSGLHAYLKLHPEVSMSSPKELDFFIKRRRWNRGLDWYRNRFDPNLPARGEVSPNYTSWPRQRGVVKKMAEVVPEVKLIYMVRDPIDRIASHWIHNYAQRRDRANIAATINMPDSSYAIRSCYAMQIKRYLLRFPMERILVIEQEDLRADRNAVLRRVFEFIGVDPNFTHPSFNEERHVSAKKVRASRLARNFARVGKREWRFWPGPSFWYWLDARRPWARSIDRPDVAAALAPETIAKLREDAEQLRELTGRDFAHWSIWGL